jgi:drug/metabolite transporter (DMT)-like permease
MSDSIASETTSALASATTAPAAAPVTGRLAWAAEGALVFSVLFASCGHLLIKYGLNSVALPSHASLFLRLQAYFLAPLVLLGLMIYGLGTVLWIVAVSKRDISYLYPVTSLNYVIVTLCGMTLFGEPVSSGRWIGIAVVMVGVVLMHASAGGRRS